MASDKLRGIIYCLTNTITNTQYIGQTTQPLKKRLKDHFAPSKADKSYIGRAIRKYGKENFNVEVIAEVNIDELNYLEQTCIMQRDTLSPRGYNLTTGGKRFNHTEETKRKISEAGKGRPTWTKGVSLSKEHRLNISKAKIGIKKSKETIENMRKARPNKRVIIDNENRIYNSIAEAERILNLFKGSIHRVLSGERKTTGGLSFNYLGDKNGR